MKAVRQAILAGALAVAASAGVAHADPFTWGTVTVWNAATPGATDTSPTEQALFSNPLRVGANRIFSSTYSGPLDLALNGINTTPATVGQFLGSGSVTYGASVAGLTQTLSKANDKWTTLMDWTFSLNSTANLAIMHDDGFSIANASNTTTITGAPGPTGSVSADVTLGPGSYNLWYVEANGLPAQLNFGLASTPVPEPATMALVATGLLGLGMIRRRKTRGVA